MANALCIPATVRLMNNGVRFKGWYVNVLEMVAYILNV